MVTISKEDVKNAFLNNKMKRYSLLYQCYREEYFYGDYTSNFIAEKITQDLGVKITDVMIRKIKVKFLKNDSQRKLAALQKVNTVPKGKETSQPTKVQKEEREWVFKNTDDEPRKNPFEDIFKGI